MASPLAVAALDAYDADLAGEHATCGDASIVRSGDFVFATVTATERDIVLDVPLLDVRLYSRRLSPDDAIAFGHALIGKAVAAKGGA